MVSRLKLMGLLMPKPVPDSVKGSLARNIFGDAVSFVRGSCLLLRNRNASKLVATRKSKHEMVSRIGIARARVLGVRGANTCRSGSEGNEGGAEALLYSGMAIGAGTLSGG